MNIFHNDSDFETLHSIISDINSFVQKHQNLKDTIPCDREHIIENSGFIIGVDVNCHIISISATKNNVSVIIKPTGLTVLEPRGSSRKFIPVVSDTVDFDEIHNCFKGDNKSYRLDKLFEIHDMLVFITKYLNENIEQSL